MGLVQAIIVDAFGLSTGNNTQPQLAGYCVSFRFASFSELQPLTACQLLRSHGPQEPLRVLEPVASVHLSFALSFRSYLLA